MEAQLDRLETAVHNVTMRLMSMGKEVQLSREKVVSIEAELGRRKKRAAEARAHGNKRKQGPLTVPTSSFRSDMRLPYAYWARVCFEFGLRGLSASDYCRWLIVDWIRMYKLHNRKKVLSITSGRIRYFDNGVQVSCAEVDMFGRRNALTGTRKSRHEVGEMVFWNWCHGHFRHIGRELGKLPGYAELNERFRKRIAFCWAPYSEVRINGTEYDPWCREHQTHGVALYLDACFTRGFRSGIQNQAQHDKWLVERNIGPLLARAKILTP